MSDQTSKRVDKLETYSTEYFKVVFRKNRVWFVTYLEPITENLSDEELVEKNLYLQSFSLDWLEIGRLQKILAKFNDYEYVEKVNIAHQFKVYRHYKVYKRRDTVYLHSLRVPNVRFIIRAGFVQAIDMLAKLWNGEYKPDPDLPPFEWRMINQALKFDHLDLHNKSFTIVKLDGTVIEAQSVRALLDLRPKKNVLVGWYKGVKNVPSINEDVTFDYIQPEYGTMFKTGTYPFDLI